MYKYKSIWVTVFLSVLLLFVFYIQVAALVVGPKIAYENQIEQQIKEVQEKVDTSNPVYRHVFEYIVYTVSDEHYVYWYNDSMENVFEMKKEDISYEEAIHVVQLMGGEVESIELGFGYDTPVFEVKSDIGYLLLDIKSKELIYYRKGEV